MLNIKTICFYSFSNLNSLNKNTFIKFFFFKINNMHVHDYVRIVLERKISNHQIVECFAHKLIIRCNHSKIIIIMMFYRCSYFTLLRKKNNKTFHIRQFAF